MILDDTAAGRRHSVIREDDGTITISMPTRYNWLLACWTAIVFTFLLLMLWLSAGGFVRLIRSLTFAMVWAIVLALNFGGWLTTFILWREHLTVERWTLSHEWRVGPISMSQARSFELERMTNPRAVRDPAGIFGPVVHQRSMGLGPDPVSGTIAFDYDMVPYRIGVGITVPEADEIIRRIKAHAPALAEAR